MSLCRKLLLSNVLIFLSLNLINCNPSEPQINKNEISLHLIDTSVKEVYLKLQQTNPDENQELLLSRDNTVLYSFNTLQKDTIICDTTVNENTSYRYKILSKTKGDENGKSLEVSAKTLSPTSHEYTWETYYFGGENGGAILYDGIIVSENEFWAVGNYYLSGEHQRTGLVKYNGNIWEEKKVWLPDFGSSDRRPTSLSAITQSYDGNILAGSGANLAMWQDTGFVPKAFFMKSMQFDGQIMKIWASSEQNVYCVGRNGAIYHYNGVYPDEGWVKLESNTTTDINDVWGIIDPVTHKQQIYCAVSNVFEYGDYKLLTIDENNKVDSIAWNMPYIRLNSVWTNKGFPIYTSGGSIYENKVGKWRENNISSKYSRRIRGTALNDIAVCGDLGLLAHYNGIDWKVYDEFLGRNMVLFSLDIKENIILAVGYEGRQGFVAVGRR